MFKFSSLRALAKQSSVSSLLKLLDCRVAALLAMTIITFSNAASAEEIDKDKAYDLATQFAECGAFFDEMGKLYDSKFMNQKEDAQLMYGLSRNAEVASMTVAAAVVDGKKAVAFSSSAKESSSIHWKRIFSPNFDDKKGADLINAQHKKCKELAPLQNAIVTEQKKRMYGFKE